MSALDAPVAQHEERFAGEGPRPTRSGRKFAMLGQELIESGLDDGCFRPMSYVLLKGGPNRSWDVAGATEIGDRIGMQAPTLMTHAQHLSEHGLLAYERPGRGKYRFNVLQDPKHGYQDAAIPPAHPHARKTSKYSTATVLWNTAPSERVSTSGPTNGRVPPTPPRPAKNRGQVEPGERAARTEADALTSIIRPPVPAST
jgi:hypothetical protein